MGLSSLEALIIARQRKCRVTFGEAVTLVEVMKASRTASGDEEITNWSEIGRGASLMEAVQEAARKEGWLT